MARRLAHIQKIGSSNLPPATNMEINTILQGDSLEELKTLPDEGVDMCITSPPYWALRDYGVDGQLGLESTFQEYIDKLCDIFDEVKRVLKKDGTCWVNLGDTYASGGGKASEQSFVRKRGKTQNHPDNPAKAKLRGAMGKSLLQIPSRFAIEMTNRGWILRNEIIWHKPNCMPSSAKDRFTVDFEKLFFFTKSKKYYFETQYEGRQGTTHSRGTKRKPPRESAGVGHKDWCKYMKNDDGLAKRMKRTVWKIAPKPYPEAHFAVYPPELIETPIKAGCPTDGVVLDPFMGSGTTAVVARDLGRNYLGIELNPEYIKLIGDRLKQKKLI